jgi:hypothetical protein
MYEFCLGVIVGYMGGFGFRTHSKRTVGTQADELVGSSAPIPIPKKIPRAWAL